MSKDEILMKELIKEANESNFEVEDFNQLNAMKRKIKNFVPTLIKYLYMFEQDNYRNAIVGILGVKGFYDATETLLKLYNHNEKKIDKWAIGDALYSIQDKRFEHEYIEMVSNKHDGNSRQMIVILLGKLRCEQAIQTLINLLKDDDVCGHAIMALGYFKDIELLHHIEPFLAHDNRWVRKEAEKAMKKIKG